MAEIPTTTPFPIPPSMVLRPDTFDAESEAFLGHFPIFETELSAMVGNLNLTKTEITAVATMVAAATIAAQASAELAQTIADSGPYDTGKVGGYLAGKTVFSLLNGFTYRSLQDQAEGEVEPLTDKAFWSKLGGVAAEDLLGLQTVSIPADAMTLPDTDPAKPGSYETSENKVMVNTLDFDPVVVTFGQFSIDAPKSWDAGPVYAELKISHPATTTNFDVSMFVQAFAINDGDDQDQAWGTPVGVITTCGVTNTSYTTAIIGPITIANNPAKSSLLKFQINRDVSGDTLAVVARVESTKVFYNTDAHTDD